MWLLDNFYRGDSEDIYTYTEYKKGDNPDDKTTYIFNKDSSFSWNNNRTSDKAIESGNGIWKLYDKNTRIELKYLNYKH